MSFERTIQMENHIILPVFGQFDANIKKIEKACGVSIVNRGDDVKISGEEKDVHKAWNILHSLVALVKKGRGNYGAESGIFHFLRGGNRPA